MTKPQAWEHNRLDSLETFVCRWHSQRAISHEGRDTFFTVRQTNSSLPIQTFQPFSSLHLPYFQGPWNLHFSIINPLASWFCSPHAVSFLPSMICYDSCHISMSFQNLKLLCLPFPVLFILMGVCLYPFSTIYFREGRGIYE